MGLPLASYIIVYIEQYFIAFKVNFAIRDTFVFLVFPHLTNYVLPNRQLFFSFVHFFIVGSKLVDLETPVFISLSSEVDGESNIEQVI